jgi:hypothetical protein
MRASLCDNLNLRGTAGFNVTIRHRLEMAEIAAKDMASRPNIPSFWLNYPSHKNHCELVHANELAAAGRYPEVPFPSARPLPPDNGERFYSEYFIEETERQQSIAGHPLNDRCHCTKCGNNSEQLTHKGPAIEAKKPEEIVAPQRFVRPRLLSPPRQINPTPMMARIEPMPPMMYQWGGVALGSALGNTTNTTAKSTTASVLCAILGVGKQTKPEWMPAAYKRLPK